MRFKKHCLSLFFVFVFSFSVSAQITSYPVLQINNIDFILSEIESTKDHSLKSIGGLFSIAHSIGPSQSRSKLSSSGLFFKAAVNVGGFLDNHLNYYPNLGLDQCQFMRSMSIGGGLYSRDVGKLILEGPRGKLSYRLVGFGPIKMYMANEGPGHLFVENGSYLFKASGGSGVDPIYEKLLAPETFSLISPNLFGTRPHIIRRKKDFTIRWASTDNQEPLFVILKQKTEFSTTAYICKFSDDGEGTIPSKILQKFYVSSVSDKEKASLSITKYRTNIFTPTGTAGPVWIEFSSQIKVDIKFRN